MQHPTEIRDYLEKALESIGLGGLVRANDANLDIVTDNTF